MPYEIHIPGTLETPPMVLRFRKIGRFVPSDLATGGLIQFEIVIDGKVQTRCGIVTQVTPSAGGNGVRYAVHDYDGLGEYILESKNPAMDSP